MLDILSKKGLSTSSDLDFAQFQEAVKGDKELKETVNNIKDHVELLNYGEAWRRAETRDPVTVTITGAAGAISYSAAFRVAAGDLLGPDQPINLNLLEIEPAMGKLEGVVMELKDCAFPLVRKITTTTDPKKAFEGADYGLLIGASPRTKGMERADLLKKNAAIFEVQGKAINETANKNIKIVVVGNPANTNAMITAHYAPSIHSRQITAMTRLDHTRGLAQLSEKLNCLTTDIERFVVWGNHSPTMYPDVTHAILSGKPLKDILDQKWLDSTFNPTVQQRGAAVINALGSSSAASAANAAIVHMHDWVKGSGNQWLSMAVPSEGEYGITPGIWYSFPVVTSPLFGLGGDYEIVGNVPIDKYSAQKMEATHQELIKEKEAIANILK